MLVIEAVRTRGALTQVEIAETTGLSPATVSNLVRELDSAGAVDLAPSVRNGRRAVQVSISAEAGLLGAIVFGDRDIRVAIGRGEQDVLARKRMPLAADYAADEHLDRAARLVAELVEDAGHRLSELRAVAVGLPAPIDTNTAGVGEDGVMPGWHHVPVATTLRTALGGAPVLVDNTANLGALAEARFGALRGVPVGVFIRASHGIGAGIVLGGEVFRGGGGTAGEIGHVTIDEHGPMCRCGNRGCLDTVAGADALLDTLRPTHGAFTLRDVVTRALAGDPACTRVLGDAGRQIGATLAGLINLLNPTVIAVGGQLAKVGEILLRPMREAVERRAIPSAVRSVRIVAAQLSADDVDLVGGLTQAQHARTAADLASLTSG